MLRFRPVDCATREPVNARLGAVARMRTRRPASRDGVLTSGGGNGQRVASFRGGVRGGDGRREIAVYENAPGVGWSWSAYKDVKTKLSSPGRGANGTSAACFEVSPGGRLAMHCIGCEATAKPFVSARQIRFWIRSPDCERDPTDEPPVYLGVATRSVRDYETGTTPGDGVRVEDERLDARGIETDGFELRAGRARPDDILRVRRNGGGESQRALLRARPVRDETTRTVRGRRSNPIVTRSFEKIEEAYGGTRIDGRREERRGERRDERREVTEGGSTCTLIHRDA